MTQRECACEGQREILKDAERENYWIGMELGSLLILTKRHSLSVRERKTLVTECLLCTKLCARSSVYNYLISWEIVDTIDFVDR